jgi:hypothetical protein
VTHLVRHASVCVVATVAAMAVGCSSAPLSPKQSSRPVQRVLTSPSGVSSPVAACRPEWLAVHGGREGADGTASGFVEVKNVGSVPCALWGAPDVRLLARGNVEMSVQQRPAASPALGPVVVAEGNVAELTLTWSNWCRKSPDPVRISLKFPSTGGAVVGPFNGPPGYDFVPPCLGRAAPSAVQIDGLR